MQHGKLKAGLASAGVLAIAFGVAAPASADYAPVPKDVVGVGSDTVQYASDFIADGDFLADTGYNTAGNKYKIVNFDATPDANARLAYGSLGTGVPDSESPPKLTCAPGTGATAGTGNGNTTHVDTPCILNPTIVLRAGVAPVLRPNGSGDGAAAAATDTHHYISYTRASSTQGATLNAGSQGPFDSITIGTDKLAMIVDNTTNAVPLSTTQLAAIYNCTSTKWSQVGGSSTDTIIPLVPQAGSGTRKSFLADIGVTTPGTCVETVEENDPTAIENATHQSTNTDTSDPSLNAIEPMSGGRLNMFQGKLGDGTSNGVGGYFHDPSCKLNVIASGTPSACAAANNTLNPPVKYVTGTPSSGTLYTDTRNLYIYFRASDLTSSTVWQPGAAAGANWVRTLFYDPCPDSPPVAGDGCTNDPIAGEVGPLGVPYYGSGAGQALISAAGINPTYAATVGGP
jgi:ABC-type phosphate transport system substrate-binding protein